MSLRGCASPGLVAVIAAVASLVMSAQDVTGPALKAAYVHRFVQFTEWPAGVLPAGVPISLCVVGDSAVRVELERTIRGVTVNGRSLAVTFGAPENPPRPCHVLYVSAVSRARATAALAPFRGQPVLTMSDLEGFNELGGIAELFYVDGALRFSIRPDELKSAGIVLSSRLLQLERKR